MRRMRLRPITLLLFAFACGDDDRAPVDMAAPPTDMPMAVDLGGERRDSGASDLGSDEPDLGEAVDLGAEEADMFVAGDMFSEADGGSTTGSVPVQCRSDADCGGVGSCNLSAPGGICIGCNDSSCPSGTDCSMFGSCVRDCSTVDDCAPGFRCSGGRCLIDTACDTTVCPPPYVCGSVGCERPECGAGCPGGFSCSGGYCVED